jgi:hypothetical protein
MKKYTCAYVISYIVSNENTDLVLESHTRIEENVLIFDRKDSAYFGINDDLEKYAQI